MLQDADVEEARVLRELLFHFLPDPFGDLDGDGNLTVRLAIPPGTFIFSTLATADLALTTLHEVTPA